jgi:mono/diheme cytochrome c family protein
VLPILQTKCQACHQPGQLAPVSFLSYESTRPWAGAIKILTATGQMPPWFAYPPYGHLLNFRALTPREVEILARWADTGAPEGNPGDAPPPLRWPEK